MSSDEMLEKLLALALRVDRDRELAFVTGLRAKHPTAENEALARRVVRRMRWRGAGSGFATGLPGNPLVAVPAALVDAAAVLRGEVEMAARIALIYDPTYLDDPEPPYELLVPIMGFSAGSAFFNELGVLAAAQLTRRAIRKHLSKATLASFKKIVLKILGKKVTQKAVLSKVVPFVGGAVGAIWNSAEVTIVGRRVVAYFADDGGAPAAKPIIN